MGIAWPRRRPASRFRKPRRVKAKVQAETAQKNIDNDDAGAPPRDGYVNVQTTRRSNILYGGMMLPLLQVGDTIRAGMAVRADPGPGALGSDGPHRRSRPRPPGARRGPVQITAIALPDHPFMGKIKDLGGTSGPPWERRFDCRVAIESPPSALRPGMTANLGDHGRNDSRRVVDFPRRLCLKPTAASSCICAHRRADSPSTT